MFNKWDKVRVKQWLAVGTHYGIIECLEEHKETEWMEWEILSVVWEWQGYSLSFDPANLYWEWMLELIEKVQQVVQPQPQVQPVVQQVPVARQEPRRERVVWRLTKFVNMIKNLEEKENDMFFGLMYDKLESILFEEYWD